MIGVKIQLKPVVFRGKVVLAIPAIPWLIEGGKYLIAFIVGAGTGYLLGEGVKSQTPKNSTPTYIYRYGSENGVNLTPRKEKDDFGLSYSLKKKKRDHIQLQQWNR